MTLLKQWFNQRVALVLNNTWYGFLQTIVFAMFPYTNWLAATTIALVTLRNGVKQGFYLLLTAVLSSYVGAYFIDPAKIVY